MTPNQDNDNGQVVPRLLTLRQAAAYVGMPYGSLRNEACLEFKGPKVPGRLKVRTRVYYDRKKIDAWICRKVLDAERG